MIVLKGTWNEDDVIVTADKEIKLWRVMINDESKVVNDIVESNEDDQQDGCPRVKTIYLHTVPELHSGRIQCLINLRDGGFATCGMDHTIRGWTRDGRCVFRCNLSERDAQLHWLPITVAELRDGILASGDFDGTIMFWKVKDDARFLIFLLMFRSSDVNHTLIYLGL